MAYKVAVVGTGDPDRSDRYAMAYRHADGYERLDNCELIGAADIVIENAVAFAERFGIDRTNVYEEYEQMLEEIQPDIVSVCTPPKTHAEVVIGAAESGVSAIHCEKPMAGAWNECQNMVSVCESEEVQLTFNHQRRFAKPYTKAKSLLENGQIGALERIEIGGPDLYEYGTHLFDMCGYMTDQEPVEWVLGQVDCERPETSYGLPQARESLARWRYASGVDGLASTGEDGMVRCHMRLIGTDGTMEIGHQDGPPLRLRRDGSDWRVVDTDRDNAWIARTHPVDRVLERAPIGPDRWFSDPSYVSRGIEEIVSALDRGVDSTLAATNTLQTTEIIFACWESARQQRRIEPPLETEENPLEVILEAKQSQSV